MAGGSLLKRCHDQAGEFFRFCVVGLLGTFVNMILFEAGYRGFFKHALPGKSGAYFANALSFVGAVLFNYLLNKIWTFKSTSSLQESGKQALQFLTVCTFGLLIRLGVMAALFALDPRLGISGWPGVRKISIESFSVLAGIAAATFWNYFWSRYWVFKAGKRQGEGQG